VKWHDHRLCLQVIILQQALLDDWTNVFTLGRSSTSYTFFNFKTMQWKDATRKSAGCPQ